MTSRRFVLWAAAALYAVMWIGGILAYVFRGGPGPHEAWTAPAFLALAALLVLVSSGRRQVAWLLLVLALGYASELAAVECDCIFGEYSYTEALAPRLFGVPLVMSAAWMILVAYVKDLLARREWPGWLEVLVASAWMTSIDLVIDPVAAGPLAYWRWVNAGWYYGIPATNFVGWFVVSAVMFLILRAERHWPRNAWPEWIGLSVILFFTVIAASHGLFGAAAVGVLLAVVHLAARR